MNIERPWTVYRTRFLVQARQLTEPLVFTDPLGREHSGKCGDYLVESSDGLRRITPRHLFEDIYVPLHNSNEPTPPPLGSLREPGRGPRSSHSLTNCFSATTETANSGWQVRGIGFGL
jgi:hypothetical protein